MLDQIERIRRKLATVPQADGRSRSFGEEKHGYRLRPPLGESQVADFEDRHGIRLPEGFRLFLLNLGDGGAGPYYGLLPLERALDVADEPTSDFLSRPSPLVPGMPRDEGWMDALGCTAEDCYRGAIALVEQGCSYYTLLIVSGPARGRVVNVDLEHQPPYFPEDLDFMSWYERWLDEMALGYELSWFGFKLPGDEADLLAIVTAKAEPADRRAGAARSLLKLPVLTAGSYGPLRSALIEGDSPGLRGTAASVLGHFRVEEAVPELRMATADPDPGVREAALRSLSNIGAEDWVVEARRLLADPAYDVKFRAMLCLTDANSLRFEDVGPLLEDGDPKVRRSAIYYLGKSDRDQVPRQGTLDEQRRWIASLNAALGRPKSIPDDAPATQTEQALRIALDDPDRYVRICAIQAIGDLRPPSLLGVLEEKIRSEPDDLVRNNLAIAISAIRSGSR